MSVQQLCNLVEHDYQPGLQQLCSNISNYLLQHASVESLPLASAELLQLLFAKLNDELTHVFLKEKGVLFPAVAAHANGQPVEAGTLLLLQNKQRIIIGIVQKIRQLLNNYQSSKEWSNNWNDCLKTFFKLETKIMQWINLEQNILYPQLQHNPY